MDLNDDDITEFQKIWQEAFHEELSIDEARAIARDVLRLYALLGQPTAQWLQPDSH
jgi:hypothetical protein